MACVKSKASRVIGLLGLMLAPGCISIKPVIVDHRTQLENQVIGSFQQVDKELVLLSSVRGEGAPLPGTPQEQKLYQAIMNREYNRDDIEQLKRQRRIGEGKDGRLHWLKSSAEDNPPPDADRLIADENRDRDTVIDHVLQTTPNLTAKDESLVRSVFHQLMVEESQPGDSVQYDDGTWRQVGDSKS